MTTISVREFSHHMAKYLKKLRAGEGFILKYRNEPIAQVMPNRQMATAIPSWKKPIKKIRIKSGISLSELLVKDRERERS